MKVNELTPGDRVESPEDVPPHTFITHCPHPVYPSLRLVIWRLSDGRISLDALSAQQEVGEVVPTTYEHERNFHLRQALMPEDWE